MCYSCAPARQSCSSRVEEASVCCVAVNLSGGCDQRLAAGPVILYSFRPSRFCFMHLGRCALSSILPLVFGGRKRREFLVFRFHWKRTRTSQRWLAPMLPTHGGIKQPRVPSLRFRSPDSFCVLLQLLLRVASAMNRLEGSRCVALLMLVQTAKTAPPARTATPTHRNSAIQRDCFRAAAGSLAMSRCEI